MGFPTVATQINPTWQKSSRNGERPNKIVLHHWAGSGPIGGTVDMMVSGSRQVSAHVVIKDTGIAGVVDENDSSWSLGNQTFERSCLTAECGNLEGTTSDAGGWRISDATAESISRWVADVATRWNIPLSRRTVLGHQEVAALGYSYSTACPGGIMARMDALIARAQQLQVGAVVEELFGGNTLLIPIRDANSGAIHVNTALTHYHELSAQRAHIALATADLSGANLPKDGQGNKTTPNWNAVQIAWLHQIIDQNAAVLKGSLGVGNSGGARALSAALFSASPAADAGVDVKPDSDVFVPGIASPSEIREYDASQRLDAGAVPVDEVSEEDKKGGQE